MTTATLPPRATSTVVAAHRPVPRSLHRPEQDRGAGAWAYVPLLLGTLALVTFACHLRWSLARSTTWHCDEIPLLVRFTGLNGQVTNEFEAARFTPTLHSLRMGTIRSFHVPDYSFAAHTTTNLWTNLGIHLFGMSHLGGRAGSLFWSLMGIVVCVCAVRTAGGGIVAVSVATLAVSLSPFATAYAAQSRGYAESMALTPLLLISLELLRRDSRSPWRALFALLCAIQLSLTVYTTWVFWVFPVLVAVAVFLPRYADFGDERVQLRLSVVLIAAATLMFMALFTVERWRTLTFAAQNGERLTGFAEWMEFAARSAEQLLPWASVLAGLAAVGTFALHRSPVRWWVWAMGTGVVMPGFVGWMNGSPGYARNLTYLVVPIAVLGGLGADAIARLASRVLPRRAVILTMTLFVLGGGSWSYAELERRTREILNPDWGRLVQDLNVEPESLGPRWVCPCLANHWQVDWYAKPVAIESLWEMEPGERIEVAMGASLGDDGRPRVYDYDPARRFIAEKPLPEFLATTPPSDVRYGIQLRWWSGIRVETNAAIGSPTPNLRTPEFIGPPAPGESGELTAADDATETASENATAMRTHGVSFLLVRYSRTPPTQAWDRLLADEALLRTELLTFAERVTNDGVIQSYLVSRDALSQVADAMRRHFDVGHTAFRVFELSSLPPSAHAQDSVQ